MNSEKRALVTGGAGFIGSNLVRFLLEKEWHVKVLDNLSSGYYENIKDLNIEFVNCDIRDFQSVNEAMKNIDVVFHLAASVGRQRSIDNPKLDSEVNLLGTINILESMVKNKIKRIVYSSSAAIYGELLHEVILETHPQSADSPYGVSKLAAEKMIISYSKIYDISFVSLRYFNIYGIGQRFDHYGNVIPIFANKILNNEAVDIYGNGMQTRDFINVKDVVFANYLSAISDNENLVLNLGTGTSVTINYLADEMHRIMNKTSQKKYKPKRSADVIHCKANIDLVKEKLSFIPKIDLIQGLEEYMKWFENEKNMEGMKWKKF